MPFEFTGGDLVVRFQENAGNAVEKQYKVEYQIGSNVKAKFIDHHKAISQEVSGLRNYSSELTFEENRTLGSGTPSREVTVRIYTQDSFGTWSDPVEEVCTNPAPEFGTAPAIAPTYDGALIKITPPTDVDLMGYKIWMHTSSTGVTTSGTLVHIGRESKVYIPIPDYDVRYFVIAPYDQFGDDTLNYSSVISTTRASVGSEGVLGYLTNESHLIAANSAGTVTGSYTPAGGTFKVWAGSTDVTTSAAFSVVSETNVDVTINATTGVYTVASLTADQGVATLRAVYDPGAGPVTVDKTYIINKAIAGAAGVDGDDGLNAKTLYITSDRQNITYDAFGAASPSTQTTTFTAAKQNTTATVTWTVKDITGTLRTPVTTYLSAGTGDSVTMTAAQFESARNSTTGVIVTGTLTDGTTLTDYITVVKVQQGAAGADGSDGADGADGVDGVSALSAYLTNEAHVVPADSAGTVSSFSGAGGTFNVFLGTNNETTGPNCTFSVNSETGVDVSIDSMYGIYTVGSMSADIGTAVLRATHNPSGAIIDKLYTISKAKSASQTAVVYIYRRHSSTPTAPTNSSTYTFSTGVVSGMNNSWSPTVPAANGNPLYVCVATAQGSGTDTITSGEWSSPVILTQDGAAGASGSAGAAGLNAASVYLYKRATSTPTLPSTTSTYTFATSVLTGHDNGWTQTIPSGTDPIYVTTATAAATTATDTIPSSEWAAAQVLAANAKTLMVTSDRQAITYNTSGTITPSTQTTTFTAVKQNTSGTVTWSITDAGGTPKTPVTTYLSASTGDSVTMTASAFDSARGSTQGVIVTGSITDITTFTDKISVIKVQDGAQGDQGPTVIIDADKTAFSYYNGALNPTSQTATFTATLNGVAGTINWSTTPNVKTGTGTTFTLTPAEMGTNTQVQVKATVGSVSSQSLGLQKMYNSGGTGGGNLIHDPNFYSSHTGGQWVMLPASGGTPTTNAPDQVSGAALGSPVILGAAAPYALEFDLSQTAARSATYGDFSSDSYIYLTGGLNKIYMSLQAARSVSSSTSTSLSVKTAFYSNTGSLVSTVTETIALTSFTTDGSYKQFVFPVTVPSGAARCTFAVELSNGSALSGRVRIANPILTYAEPGSDQTSIITGPAEGTIECDAAGSPVNLPRTFQFVRMHGSADVTTTSTWSIVGTNAGVTASIGSATGMVSVSGMSAAEQTLNIQSVYQGVTRNFSFKLTKVLGTGGNTANPSAPKTVTDTVNVNTSMSGNVTNAGAVGFGVGMLNAPLKLTAVSTSIACSAVVNFDVRWPLSGTCTQTIYGEFFIKIGGVWSSIASESQCQTNAVYYSGSGTLPNGQPYSSGHKVTGSLVFTVSKTGLVAGTAYEIDMKLRTTYSGTGDSLEDETVIKAEVKAIG